MSVLHVVRLPPNSVVGNRRALIANLGPAFAVPQGDSVVFDFSSVCWIDPLGASLTAALIDQCLADGVKCSYVRSRNALGNDFLSRIGFHTRYNFGAAPESDAGRVQLTNLKSRDSSYVALLTNLVQREVNLGEEGQHKVQLALTELLTNAFDHSESPLGCWSCAQTVFGERMIRICVADLGVGLLAKVTAFVNAHDQLDSNRVLEKARKVKNDLDAIRFATQGGFSTRGRDADERGGLGFYSLKKIARHTGGQLVVISGKAGVRYYHSAKGGAAVDYDAVYPFGYPGTAVQLDMPVTGIKETTPDEEDFVL